MKRTLREIGARFLETGGCLALGLVLAAGIGRAGQPGTKQHGKETPAAGNTQTQKLSAAGMAGQRVHIDPRTGKVREPEQEESKQLSDQMRRLAGPSVKQLRAVRHPNGMRTLDTQGAFLSYSVAKVNADGTVSRECVKSLDEAKAWRKANATPRTPEKEAAGVQ